MSAIDKAQVISLSEGFGAIVVKGPNIKVEVFDDGRIVAYTAGEIQKRPPVSARTLSGTASPAGLTIGQQMDNGTIFAGVSPTTQRPMYTTPKDTGLFANWYKAMDHAGTLHAHGHKDWRVPSKAELNVLFNNRALIRNFDETGSDRTGWYWSSSRTLGHGAWTQRFSDGSEHQTYVLYHLPLRCVRG